MTTVKELITMLLDQPLDSEVVMEGCPGFVVNNEDCEGENSNPDVNKVVLQRLGMRGTPVVILLR